METINQDREKLPTELQENIRHIVQYQNRIRNVQRQTPEDFLTIFNLQADMLVFIGRVSTYCETVAEEKKLMRETVYWETYQNSPKQKEMNANLAALPYKKEEIEWNGMARRWKTALRTIEHQMNALKYKHKDKEKVREEDRYHWEAHR